MTFTQWFLFILIIQFVHFFGTWKLYQRAGYKPWQAAIPIYNAAVLMKIINRPRWWVLMFFMPIINLIIFPVVWVETARSFGKRSATDTFLTLISFGFYLYTINYNDQLEHIKDRSLKPRTAFGEWFSSILFAVVIATLVHTYFIQPYIIPTGSLEKTLLTGDFLFVSKYHYGARVPQTAVSFPMVHDTIPLARVRSYFKNPQLPYMRLPKLQKIKRNEIVVFSWPADTVRQFFKKESRVDKPIDKKSNYVKRCVAIPGDTLEIIDGIIHINGKRTQLPDRAKPIYGYTAYSKTGISSRELIQAGIRDLTRRFRIESNISQQQLNALFANGPGEVVGGVRGEVDSAVAADLQVRGDRGDRDGTAGPEGLGGADPEALEDRGEDRARRGGVEVGELGVGHGAKHLDAALEPAVLGGREEAVRGPLLAGSGEDQARERGKAVHGLDDQREVLARLHVPHMQHERRRARGSGEAIEVVLAIPDQVELGRGGGELLEDA